jgi:hypothetical protein
MKVTKEQLKQIIKEELGRMDAADEEVDLGTMVDDLGTPENILLTVGALLGEKPELKSGLQPILDNPDSLESVKQALQSVAAEDPEFKASFKYYYDFFISG